MTPPLQCLADMVDVGIKHGSAEVWAQRGELLPGWARLSPARHPALRPPRSPAPASKGLSSFRPVFNISTIFNLPSAPWHILAGLDSPWPTRAPTTIATKISQLQNSLALYFEAASPHTSAESHKHTYKQIQTFPRQSDIQEITTPCLGFFFFFIFLLGFLFPHHKEISSTSS